MAEKTFVVTFPGAGEILVPGFVAIDEMRQVNDYGKVEYSIRYDDTNLTQVSQVTISNSVVPPMTGAGIVELNKIHYPSGSWAYTVYSATAAAVSTGQKTMTVVGMATGIDCPVAGFVAVDKMQQLTDDGEIALFVRYDTAAPTQIHQLTVTATGPDRVPPAGGLDLGIVNVRNGWLYAYYVDQPLPAAS